jgi:hypothetical protein
MPYRSHHSAAVAQTHILTAEDTVRTTHEIVRTTDELVSTIEDAIERVTVTEIEACKALEEEFGSSVDADYVPGKTRFRDVLAARFGLSHLSAEDLCDALERSGRIRFMNSAEGMGWNIHIGPEPDREDDMA